MQTLNEILSECKWSGECGVATDKNTTHNYIDGFYEKEFAKYRYKNVKILEIGISSGHSLLLWDKYFPNHAGVYGLDIYDGRIIQDALQNDKIFIKIENAYDPRVSSGLPNFDIIIDDGPHTLESMISCINLYLPKLNNGGVLVIEDVQSLDWMPVLCNIFEKAKQNGDEFDIVDLRETKGRYDDLMFIIRRK